MPRPELRCFGDRLTKHNASTRYGLPRGRLDNGKGRVGTALAVKQCSVPALVLFSPHGYDRCKFLLENYAPFRSPLCQIETADRAINWKENFTFISSIIVQFFKKVKREGKMIGNRFPASRYSRLRVRGREKRKNHGHSWHL